MLMKVLLSIKPQYVEKSFLEKSDMNFEKRI